MVQLTKRSFVKRIEDQKKFVLSYAMKYLRREFQRNFKKGKSTSEEKESFMAYYGIREMDLKYNSVSNKNIQKIFSNSLLKSDL